MAINRKNKILRAKDCNIGDIAVVEQVDGENVWVNISPEEVNVLLGNSSDVNPTMTAAQIQAVVDAKTAGQVVKFAPGTYELGNNSLILKNGVHLDCGFEGSVIVNSSSANGSLMDNNIAAVITISGFPVITNTNGFGSKVILTNTLSRIEGFYLEAVLVVSQSGINNPIINKVVKNTTGLNIAFTRTDVGTSSYVFACKTDNLVKHSKYQAIQSDGSARFGFLASGRDNGAFILDTYDSAGAKADTLLSCDLISYQIYFGKLSQ